ncbi:hypothetical protein SY2F82_35550 [Streptomyces sp. Y2F8-2]|nr:hypothetical protein SY2F82_35550 [Streptomyces sp. Y2F8-2]
MTSVPVGPVQVAVQGAGLDGVIGVVELARVNCRSDPKCASMGLAQDALVGVKQSSALFLAAHRRILLPLWADGLSRMT